MNKLAFIEQLRERIVEVANEELAGTGWTAEHCPWLEYWLTYYSGRSAHDSESALRRFAPSAGATTAADYLEPAAHRVRAAIRRWRRTGEIEPEFHATVSRGPEQIQTQLGDGQPLDSHARTRMESAFGQQLPDVRVHTGSPASEAAREHDARAIAFGNDIAFAPGEYRPGTPIGDILLAHELAHSVQQTSATSVGATSAAASEEKDANRGVGTAIARLLGLTQRRPSFQPVRGLALRRCSNKFPIDLSDEHALDDVRFGELPDQAWLRQFRAALPQYENIDLDPTHARDDGIMTPSGIRVPIEAGHFLNPRRHYMHKDAAFLAYEGDIHLAELFETRNPAVQSLTDNARGGTITDKHLDLDGYAGWQRSMKAVREGTQVGLMAADAVFAAGDVYGLLRSGEPPTPPMPEPVPIPEDLAALKASEAAEKLGLPTPPEGYHWGKNGARLTVARDPVPGGSKLPKLRYDAKTRTFEPESKYIPPKPAVVRASQPPADLEEAATKAIALRDSLEDVGAKTIARSASGVEKTSGWGADIKSLDPVADLSAKIGAEPAPSAMDAAGRPGSYNLSHAEKQVAAVTEGADAIGVSRPMCADCQRFFQKLAAYRGGPIVVADPTGVRIFYPDGRLISATDVASLAWPQAADSDDKDDQ